MTRTEFRKDPERVKALREILATSILMEAMQVNRDEGPVTDAISSDITPTYACAALGMAKGFEKFYWSLLEMATYPPDSREPEPTYQLAEEEVTN